MPPNLKLLNLSHNGIYTMSQQIFEMAALDTVDLSYNMISVWVSDDIDYTKCTIKTLDISFNVKLK